MVSFDGIQLRQRKTQVCQHRPVHLGQAGQVQHADRVAGEVRVVERLGDAQSREIEVVVAVGTAAHQRGEERVRHRLAGAPEVPHPVLHLQRLAEGGRHQKFALLPDEQRSDLRDVRLPRREAGERGAPTHPVLE